VTQLLQKQLIKHEPLHALNQPCFQEDVKTIFVRITPNILDNDILLMSSSPRDLGYFDIHHSPHKMTPAVFALPHLPCRNTETVHDAHVYAHGHPCDAPLKRIKTNGPLAADRYLFDVQLLLHTAHHPAKASHITGRITSDYTNPKQHIQSTSTLHHR
jgi:hypothetical protein